MPGRMRHQVENEIMHAEFCGEPFDPQPTQVSTNGLVYRFEKGYDYTVVLASDD